MVLDVDIKFGEHYYVTSYLKHGRTGLGFRAVLQVVEEWQGILESCVKEDVKYQEQGPEQQ